MTNFARSTKAFGASVCLAAVLAVAGCNAETTGVDVNRFDGVYQLESVNAAAIPTTVSGSGDDRIDVISGRILISGTTIGYRVARVVVVGGDETDSVLDYGGTYSFDGVYLNMVPTGTTDTIRIRYQGTVMEGEHDGKVYTFRKQ
jgi:hypothetical protein